MRISDWSSDVCSSDLADANAAGEQGAGSGYTANEIVVTAQKRVESIQDVPIAMTALSQDDLTEQKIESGADIMRAVPNLTFSKSKFSEIGRASCGERVCQYV